MRCEHRHRAEDTADARQQVEGERAQLREASAQENRDVADFLGISCGATASAVVIPSGTDVITAAAMTAPSTNV